MKRDGDWGLFVFAAAAVVIVAVFAFMLITSEGAPVRPEWVELDRATQGTVLVRPAAVDAILGPGEVVLDDSGGTRHNAHTQIVVGILRINIRGTAAQARAMLASGTR